MQTRIYTTRSRMQCMPKASVRGLCPVSPIRPRLCSPQCTARRPLHIVSAAGVAHPGEEANGEIMGQFIPSLSVPDTTMAKGGGGGQNFGSGGSLGAVMEKSKMQFVMPTPPQQAPKLDDGGDGGGMGKNINNGGGGGDGDGGDDDDYFADGEDPEGDGQGGGGDGFFRTAIPEQYDRISIGVVLQEWYKTIADLPLFIRRAVEMGLFSSAQLVRFLSMDVRPNVARTVSRTLPSEWARGFVGRLMADPAFVQKLAFEQVLAFSSSMFYEWRVRGESFKKELDLALINSVGMAAAVGTTVWLTAPSRAYGAVHKFPWQQMLANLPACVFDASGPLRNYSRTARVGGFFASMAQLGAVGAVTGGATAVLSAAAVKLHQKADPEYQPSVPVPDAARSAGGLAAFFGINANTRYQLLGGMDRYLLGHSNFMWTYMAMSAIARGMFATVGEGSRPFWQGLPAAPAFEQRPRQSARVKRVRKKKAPKAPLAVEAAGVAVPAAAVAGEGLALASSSSSVPEGELSFEQQQQRLQQEEVGSSAAAVAALESYQPVTAADGLELVPDGSESGVAAGVEAAAESQLTSAPAVMGSSDSLEALLRDPQLRHQPSMSDTAMGMALRDAVTQAVS